LYDNGSNPDASARDDVANAHLDQVATAQLAVDREIKERTVEPEADRPNLLWFERALGAQHSTFIPRTKFVEGRIYDECPIAHLHRLVGSANIPATAKLM
jgi:hypothetical protein